MNEQLLIEYEMTMHNNVILSRSEGSHNNQILRSLHSLRMTGDRTAPSLTKREGVKNHFLTSLPTNLLTFKPAFTLAEVLITLGIIGVVAALTIPNLITSYKVHVIHKKLLKSYSVIQQVVRMMKYDDLEPEMYIANSKTPFYKTFIKYMSGATDCGSGYVNKCFSVWDTYMNSGWSPAVMDDGCIISSDGMVYLFENMYSTSTANPILITVDINGYKAKPNKLGLDLFVFKLVDGEFKPYGAQGTNASYEVWKRTYKAFNDPNYIKYLLKTVK